MKIKNRKNVFIFVLTLFLCTSILINVLLAYKYKDNMGGGGRKGNYISI